MTFAALVRRGLLAGLLAGLSSALVLWFVTEPVIDRALAIEEAREAAGPVANHGGSLAHSHAGGELVSRTQQVVAGGLTVIVVGVLLGAVFAVVFAKVRHRLPAADHQRSVLLAAMGFAAFTLLPAIKIPANPPAVGDPATVDQRTTLYVGTMVIGLLTVAAVVAVNRWLTSRGVAAGTRFAAAAGLVAVIVGVVMAVLPGTPDQVPEDVPATLLWDFRLASLAQLAVLWAVLGIAFGLLVERAGATASEKAAPEPAAG